MVPVSVVIITKNEAEIIRHSINMAKAITDDIVIIDNGSTDNTQEIALSNNCRFFSKTWDGYGANKNKGINLAQYDWILSIDADEIVDEELINALHQLDYENPNIVYNIRFKTYFGNKLIRFGSWGRDHHIRLFNRSQIKWSELPVHETLLFPEDVHVKNIAGHIHHYSVKDATECRNKAIQYASLSAMKYYESGKKSNFIKLYLASLFSFLRNYIFYKGFLDGREGWHIAINAAKQTWFKYHYLQILERTAIPKISYTIKEPLIYMYPATDQAV